MRSSESSILHHFKPSSQASSSLPPSRHASPALVPPDVIPSAEAINNRKQQQQHRPPSGLSSASSGGGVDSPDFGGVDGCEAGVGGTIDSMRQEASHSISQLGSAKEATLLNELLYMKKGWLMMQTTSPTDVEKESWNKHWFVLRGASMKYYKDANAEDEAEAEGWCSGDARGKKNLME